MVFARVVFREKLYTAKDTKIARQPEHITQEKKNQVSRNTPENPQKEKEGG